VQKHEELHEWLQLAQLAGEVLRGQPSRLAFMEPTQSACEVDSLDSRMLAHVSDCKASGAAEGVPASLSEEGTAAADGSSSHDAWAEQGQGLPYTSPAAIETRAHVDRAARPHGMIDEWQPHAGQAAENFVAKPTSDAFAQVARSAEPLAEYPMRAEAAVLCHERRPCGTASTEQPCSWIANEDCGKKEQVLSPDVEVANMHSAQSVTTSPPAPLPSDQGLGCGGLSPPSAGSPLSWPPGSAVKAPALAVPPLVPPVPIPQMAQQPPPPLPMTNSIAQPASMWSSSSTESSRRLEDTVASMQAQQTRGCSLATTVGSTATVTSASQAQQLLGGASLTSAAGNSATIDLGGTTGVDLVMSKPALLYSCVYSGARLVASPSRSRASTRTMMHSGSAAVAPAKADTHSTIMSEGNISMCSTNSKSEAVPLTTTPAFPQQASQRSAGSPQPQPYGVSGAQQRSLSGGGHSSAPPQSGHPSVTPRFTTARQGMEMQAVPMQPTRALPPRTPPPRLPSGVGSPDVFQTTSGSPLRSHELRSPTESSGGVVARPNSYATNSHCSRLGYASSRSCPGDAKMMRLRSLSPQSREGSLGPTGRPLSCASQRVCVQAGASGALRAGSPQLHMPQRPAPAPSSAPPHAAQPTLRQPASQPPPPPPLLLQQHGSTVPVHSMTGHPGRASQQYGDATGSATSPFKASPLVQPLAAGCGHPMSSARPLTPEPAKRAPAQQPLQTHSPQPLWRSAAGAFGAPGPSWSYSCEGGAMGGAHGIRAGGMPELWQHPPRSLSPQLPSGLTGDGTSCGSSRTAPLVGPCACCAYPGGSGVLAATSNQPSPAMPLRRAFSPGPGQTERPRTPLGSGHVSPLPGTAVQAPPGGNRSLTPQPPGCHAPGALSAPFLPLRWGDERVAFRSSCAAPAPALAPRGSLGRAMT
jgi:hypothetical protein